MGIPIPIPTPTRTPPPARAADTVTNMAAVNTALANSFLFMPEPPCASRQTIADGFPMGYGRPPARERSDRRGIIDRVAKVPQDEIPTLGNRRRGIPRILLSELPAISPGPAPAEKSKDLVLTRRRG